MAEMNEAWAKWWADFKRRPENRTTILDGEQFVERIARAAFVGAWVRARQVG